MITVFQSRCASLAALGLLLAMSVVGAQEARPEWMSVGAPSAAARAVEQTVADAMGRQAGTLGFETLSAEAVVQRLSKKAPRDRLFISGRPADIAALVRGDRFRSLATLGFELVNPRAGASLIYLFTNSEKSQSLRGTPRVHFAARAGDLTERDVAAVIARALGGAPVAVASNSPINAARALLASAASGGADLVAVHDTDPSPFVHEFVGAYTRLRTASEGHSLRLVTLPLDSSAGVERLPAHQLQALATGVTIVQVPFVTNTLSRLDVPRLEARGDEALAVLASKSSPEALWVLSNVRTAGGEAAYQRLRRMLADAYLPALTRDAGFLARCDEGGAAQYVSYLVDAQLADPQNLARALAFRSDLTLRMSRGRPADVAALTDQIMLFETALRQRVNVDLGRPADVARQLAGPRGTVRAQFSDDEATLFRLALDDLQAALGAARDVRTKRLADARAKLLTIVAKGAGAACQGAGLGLFGRGLDPFFYLAYLDALTALDQVQP